MILQVPRTMLRCFFVWALFSSVALNSPSQGSVDPKAIEAALEQIGLLPDQPDKDTASRTKIELGRQLFFDPRLSGNNAMNCATCHHPGMGWTDGLTRGRGFNHQELRRNTPTILNVRHYPLLFWDGRAKGLEEQALGPIQSPVEMNQDIEALLLELNRVSEYVLKFNEVFGASGIAPENIAKAIAGFERTVISSSKSPFGRFQKFRAALSPAQKKGLLLFTGKARCILCHAGPAFTDGGFHNIGVGPTHGLQDRGRYEVLPLPAMRKAFKTPSLLDVTRTPPYMHDGNLKTLGEVIEFYDRGGDNRESLDPLMRPLGLSREEKTNLLEFLTALTSPPEPFFVPTLPAAWNPTSLKEIMHWNLQRVKMIQSNLKQGSARSIYLHAVGIQDNIAHIRVMPPELNQEEEQRFYSYLEQLKEDAKALTQMSKTTGISATDLSNRFMELKSSCNRCHMNFRPEGLIKLD